uniref:Uncharacterized protein n=1 Tax=Fagus sylvatica TaxID=28930 RepID=A0A2N9J1I6_FAGSY
MESQAEEPVRKKMESLRLLCEREIPIQQQKMDSFAASFFKSLQSIQSTAQQTLQNQGKVGELKAKLREAEDDMVKALAVKTRKEAKRMAIMDSISAKNARVEELKRSVQLLMAKRDQYATVVSQQSLALAASEEKSNKNDECKGETQEAISWYNRVLGFHVEAGHGFLPQLTNHQESSMISTSAPAQSMSTDRSESPTKKNDHQVLHEEGTTPSTKLHYARGIKPLTWR